MRTIGLLGGMSWESTLAYYRIINSCVKSRLGGLHSAQVVLYSVDFDPLERAQHRGDWGQVAGILTAAARKVEAGGADFLLICTNTMHKVAAEVEAAVNIPLLHIADATAVALQQDGIERVGLLGTAFTMEQDFYRARLEDKYGLQVMLPGLEDRQDVHTVIYTELCQGIISEGSRKKYLDIVGALAAAGAEAVILGCTEIGMLISQADTSVRLYDTTAIHAEGPVSMALTAPPI